MSYATRIANLKPEGAYQVLAHANQLEAEGREIIHLEIGQPDYATFENVSEAGIAAIRAGHTRYTPPSGMPSFREAIAEDSGQRRGISIQPDEVVISPGGKPNLFFPTLALVEPGDEVIYPDPGFPTYEAMIGLAGGVPMPVPLLEESNFSFDLDVFDRLVSKRTKLIILNSPSNPTGGVIPLADLEHIAQKAQEFNCWVMSDEIYRAPRLRRIEDKLHRVLARYEGTHRHRRWFLQNIFDDRLATRLRDHAARTGFARRSFADAFRGVHGTLHAICRAGSHHRAAGYGGCNGGRIPAPARCNR